MELRQLRYFVTVAEELHFGRAAERLHIVQPAVSQQVRRLERELGVTLLDRSPRRVNLTAEGERLLPEARAVLAAADRTAAVAASLSTVNGAVLRIGTSTGLSMRLETGLKAIARLIDGTEMHLDSRPVYEQLEAIRTGELDIAIVRAAEDSDLLHGPGLRAVSLWTEQVRAAVPAGHPLAREHALQLERLRDLTARLPHKTCDPLLRAFMLDACRRAGFTPRLGRPAGLLQDTLVEVGTGSPAWTPVYGDIDPASITTQVVLVPLEPELRVSATLVTSAARSDACVDTLYRAFAS
jgi:DNA-binding transcriptional LysR family regulator